jgi:hypothetical protein
MLLRLLRQRVNDRIPSRLPPDARVAHKTGNLPGVMHDAGLIYTPAGPIAVVLLAGDVVDDEAVRGGMARLARRLDGYARAGGFGRPTAPPLLWDPALDARVRPLVAGAPALDLVVADLATGQVIAVDGGSGWVASALTELRAAAANGAAAAPELVPAGLAGAGPYPASVVAAIPAGARLTYEAATDEAGRRREAAVVRVEGGLYVLLARSAPSDEVDLPRLGATIHAYLSGCAWSHPSAAPCDA